MGTGQEDSQFQSFKKLLPLLWPAARSGLRGRVAVSFVFLVLAKVSSLSVPFFLKEAVDSLNNAGAVGPLMQILRDAGILVPAALLVAWACARTGAVVFDNLREGTFARVVQNAIRKVALQSFCHLHTLSLRFHLDRRTGGLSRAIDRGTKGIEFMFVFMMFSVVPTLLEIVFVCVLLWGFFDWRFAVLPLVMIVAYVALTFWITNWRIGVRRAMNRADQNSNNRAVDSLLNFETVKYFGNEDFEAERYDQGMADYEQAAVKNRTSLSVLNIAQSATVSLGMGALMVMAALEVLAVRMTVGEFVMVNAYLIQLSLPLNMLGFVYREIRQALIDIHTMFELMREPVEVRDCPGARDLVLAGARLEFRDVVFGYDPRRMILRGLSFGVEPGQTLAIVGASGAGKSTMSRLLYRFYDVKRGAILLDGQNIAKVTQHSLRRAIGIVPQDTVLFNESILYNIAYGRPGATRAAVEQAARTARIHDFISSLPDGYDTLVGERGLKLSGGEKQRVAIARTVLKDPAVLVFDEATSALDTTTEQEIQTSLDIVSRHRTTLVIAHRLSTVVGADDIIVLDHGQIVERGTHSDLMVRDAHYAQMWRKQQILS